MYSQEFSPNLEEEQDESHQESFHMQNHPRYMEFEANNVRNFNQMQFVNSQSNPLMFPNGSNLYRQRLADEALAMITDDRRNYPLICDRLAAMERRLQILERIMLPSSSSLEIEHARMQGIGKEPVNLPSFRVSEFPSPYNPPLNNQPLRSNSMEMQISYNPNNYSPAPKERHLITVRLLLYN